MSFLRYRNTAKAPPPTRSTSGLGAAGGAPAGAASAGAAARLMEEARAHERAGRVQQAVAAYTSAIEGATAEGNGRVLAESLRRLGVVRVQRQEMDEGLRLMQRSHAVACELGADVLASEALNVIAGVHMLAGRWGEARDTFRRARGLAATAAAVRARIDQNLGIIANIHGEFELALAHYTESLRAFELAEDVHGRATAYNNLGMISADRERWDDADRYFRLSLELADQLGDARLRGLGLLNHTEVFIARQQYEAARGSAEGALRIFEQLGFRDQKSGAYKFLGVVYRDTGKLALAEARLRRAIELAVEAGSTLHEAEASRELALVYQALGRNQDALKLLNASHRLFGRIDARVDLVDVASRRARLESVYLAVVREWGQSIESADSYTHGHCERVATYAVAVARGLGLDEAELTTIRLGAYLHDVGKVRVPHEILNKPGRLTPEEFEVMKMHPVYGIELLAAVEFPWDIKPIIRSHHERFDGSGYPDGLRGGEIPLNAQIIGIADVYDALTTTRSYRGAMTKEKALAIMDNERPHWRPDVFAAFRASVGAI
jgi:putative nucleotidyltransferase with HDIG domain